MNYKAKIATAVATAALLASSFAPIAFADIESSIVDNGNNSDNTINITQNVTLTLSQTNTANINNTINARANTGGNRANNNTNSDINIDTGNATANADATNTGGGNTLNVTLPGGNVNQDITGNGNNSTSLVKVVNNTTLTGSGQSNTCNGDNKVRRRARTGRNRANNNTGGTINIPTGNATTNGTATNTCGSNSATIL